MIPGKDGRVRQALVRTSTGLLRRPAVKLAVLDVVKECKPVTGITKFNQGLREGVCADGTPRCCDATKHDYQGKCDVAPEDDRDLSRD